MLISSLSTRPSLQYGQRQSYRPVDKSHQTETFAYTVKSFSRIFNGVKVIFSTYFLGKLDVHMQNNEARLIHYTILKN